MIRYFLVVSYLGDNYYGSQFQKEFPSVEKELSRGVSVLLGETIKVKLFSRTDRGVHALRARAYFESNQEINQASFLRGINAVLNDDIKVLQLLRENHEGRTVFKKRIKTYLYLVYNHKYYFPPFLKQRALWVREYLDIDLMKQSIIHLIGDKNWEYFSATGSPRQSSIRNVINIKILRKGHLVFIFIKGEGFLYKMVRMLTGLLLEIGKGNYPPEYFLDIFSGRKKHQRRVLPPYGLYLLSS